MFAAIALSLPFVLLLAAEGVCRLFGHGGYPPIIHHVGSDDGQEWYTTFRPGVDSFFYQHRSRTGGMRELHFVTPKPPGTVRILLLGGSAMQGWPQPRPLTNGAFLETMLGQLWDDGRKPEVLNMGATAMASFPATYFLNAMLDHDPDLVVIMSGNNEFYGAYGVSSLHSAGTSPTGMRCMRQLRGLGLTQWLAARLTPAEPPDETSNKALMELVAVNQAVGPHDPLRAAAETTLRSNLTTMVNVCVGQGIPVMVCTLPTNERGLAPVGADVAPAVTPEAAAQFDSLLARGREAIDPAAAVEALHSAIALYADNAESHFLLGAALSRLGRHDEALVEYTAARDLDTMPWRAVTSANATVRSLAERGAVVCDMEAAFRAASPEGAIGWELMDDHVHMSVVGQVLFARTVAGCMARFPRVTGVSVDAAKLAALPDDQTYIRDAGRSIFTDYAVASRMISLFDIAFLARSNPVARQGWHDRRDGLVAQMDELDRRALAHWKDPGLHVTNQRPLSFVVGYYRMTAGHYAAALPLLEMAQSSLSEISLWRLQLGWYMIKCRRELHERPTDEDRQVCAETIRIGRLLDKFVGFPDPIGPAYLGLTYHAVGRYDAAVYYLDNAVRYVRGAEGAEVVYALADSLIKTGEIERARELLHLALKDPTFADTAQGLLDQLAGSTANDGDGS